MNLLFICRNNQMRSRTAESIYNSNSMYNTRSAGTASTTRMKISSELIHRADMIFYYKH
jgi:predicted protein tyrosine phosphatase